MTKSKEKAKKPPLYKALDIIGVVLCILLVPLVIINMTMAIQTFTQPDVPPNFMGYTPLIITSGSMDPTFSANDLVVIKTVDDPAALQVGDVISYFENDYLITHRIIEVTSSEDQPILYVTQGDNNNAPDRIHVKPDKVFGKYITCFKDLGAFALFMQTPTGMLLLVVLPIIALFVMFYVVDKLRYKQAMKEQLEKETASKESKTESDPAPVAE